MTMLLNDTQLVPQHLSNTEDPGSDEVIYASHGRQSFAPCCRKCDYHVFNACWSKAKIWVDGSRAATHQERF